MYVSCFQQSRDRTIIDQLKQQLESLGDALATEKRERERLQNEMRIIEGQVKAQVIILLYVYLIVETNIRNVRIFTTQSLVLSAFLKF